ncbi:uncharacterized protein BJ212DRAFT_1294249 [Suillus subaureus]|uniref:Uncharacterized protein n=1 Tax=Suillus subaureus TaxID=48587 RepID=A0A9P7JJR2_9AGAM|nr:uncharacterized protein BJ212DRAFT_1294249 [Suillus subaureus]KAG1826811.1 hypothetical protein BJ212DRAFT_1294249 [Suillus subaureus]
MQMHKDSGSNFLNLAAALKIILGQTIKDADIPQAKHILHEYLIKFIKCTDSGHSCLKGSTNYSTNNHGTGELEVSFFHAFEKDQELQMMLGNILAAEKLADENDRSVIDCIQLMLATDSNTLSRVLMGSNSVNIQFCLGTHTKSGLSHNQQHQLIIHYQNTNPQACIVSIMTHASTENSDLNYLLTHTNFYNYIILDG